MAKTEQKPIHGVQINMNVDMLLFCDPPVEGDKNITKLQTNLGNIKHDIKQLIESAYNRTDWDDTDIVINSFTYITEDNLTDYVQGEVYIMEEGI